jgi:uncharacterized membrane protein YesL
VLGARVSPDIDLSFTLHALWDLMTSNTLIFMSLLAGGIILGLPLAVAAYFISNSFFHQKSPLKTTAL